MQCLKLFELFMQMMARHRTVFAARGNVTKRWMRAQIPARDASNETRSTSGSSGDRSDAGNQHPDLDQLKSRINASIQHLGGSVVPKLNWSSPSDAVWISPSGLRCHNADEVLLLLKSSDRAAHDIDVLQQLSAGCDAARVEPALVLRRWFPLHHDREFRCFVRDHRLLAISQRDPTQHCPAALADKQQIHAAVQRFHAERICERFTLSDCALSTPFSNCK